MKSKKPKAWEKNLDGDGMSDEEYRRTFKARMMKKHGLTAAQFKKVGRDLVKAAKKALKLAGRSWVTR